MTQSALHAKLRNISKYPFSLLVHLPHFLAWIFNHYSLTSWLEYSIITPSLPGLNIQSLLSHFLAWIFNHYSLTSWPEYSIFTPSLPMAWIFNHYSLTSWPKYSIITPSLPGLDIQSLLPHFLASIFNHYSFTS